MKLTKIFNFFKKPLLALGLLAGILIPSANAASISSAIAAGTPLTLLSNSNVRIDSVVFINTNTTTAASLWFYDSKSNLTNYVRSASTRYSLTTSNVVTTFTNSSGIVMTNTMAVLARVATAVTASTNERPRLSPMIIPPSEHLVVTDVGLIPFQGLTVYSTAAGTINISYDTIR